MFSHRIICLSFGVLVLIQDKTQLNVETDEIEIWLPAYEDADEVGEGEGESRDGGSPSYFAGIRNPKKSNKIMYTLFRNHFSIFNHYILSNMKYNE